MADEAFTIDRDQDGRYSNYVGNNQSWFDDCWDWDEVPAARFASIAWQIANGPVMSPAYVRWHPRIIAASLQRSDHDGRLLASVDVITPEPEALRNSDWTGGRFWPTWPAEALGGRYRYFWPEGEELARAPHILPSVSLRFAVVGTRIFAPPTEPLALSELQDAAKRCIADLVAELNATINPAITRLESS